MWGALKFLVVAGELEHMVYAIYKLAKGETDH
jgi:hypothetical protein